MHDFLIRLKFVKWHDIAALPLMLIALIVAPIYRLWRKELWLVMERQGEARDNGYWFFRYLRLQQPEVDAVYVINPLSADFQKVDTLGTTIRPRTLRHWIYYFAAQYNISSQKDGNPNAALCFVMENYLHKNNHRIFLQHGITQNNVAWLNYKISHFDMFSCAASREQQFVVSTLNYPEAVAKLVGFARYDNLLSPHTVHRQILVMPTWREWLGRISSDTTHFEQSATFTDSEYYRVWSALLANEQLKTMLIATDTTLFFYPHANMQQYISHFKTLATDRIIVADDRHYDVQQLLMESAALITDYSSIYFDFAYMDKPLAYYQFDYDKFRQGQYGEGYFSYCNNGFGPIVSSEDEIIGWIAGVINSDFANNPQYAARAKQFFAFRDSNNCSRTYNAICQLNTK